MLITSNQIKSSKAVALIVLLSTRAAKINKKSSL